MKAKARPRRQPGQMNNTEAKYGEHLEDLKVMGKILEYSFEPEKFRLADKTYYTPDFRVIMPDLSIEFHEVKGSWRAPNQDDAKVKIKVAAEMNQCYRFVSAEVVSKKNGGGWKMTEF